MNCTPEYERFPTEAQQLSFCEDYLAQLHKQTPKAAAAEGTVAEAAEAAAAARAAAARALMLEARLFVVADHW
jgi:hypothetical protein